jgi:hypothetical protein
MWGVTTLLAGTVAGAAAGMMMAAVEMIYGWASSAHTAWDAPMGIWAYIGGLNYFGHPANHIWPIVLGIGGHLMNSMVVGVLFVSVLAVLRPRDNVTPIMLGVAYALGLWALMRYVLLPLNAGEDKLFTTDLVSPQWVWWVAHIALGTTLGLVYLLFGRWRLAAPAPHRLQDVREPHVHKAA